MTRPTLLPLRRPRTRRLAAVPAAVAAVAAPAAVAPADAAVAPAVASATASPGPGTGIGTSAATTTLYVVQRGDTLTSVAARTGTDVATLVRLNALADPDHLVPGMRLAVPVHVTVTAPAPAQPPTAVSYTVRAGDSLWTIAMRSGTSVEAIVAANHLRPGDAIMPGQVLLLPGADLPARPVPKPKPVTPPAVHVVVSGDTLSGIAVRYHVRLAALLRANRLGTDAVLRPGQKLVLPGVAATPTPRPAPAPTHGYVVRRGDTLSGIAFAAGIPLTAVTALNHLSASDVIVPGQRLLLPGPAPVPATSGTGTTGTSGTTVVAEAGPSRTVRDAAAINRAALAARPAPSPARVRELVRAAARALGVDPSLALAVADVESGFDQRRVSVANAIGVMQVVPSSGRWASAIVGRPLDLLDATDDVTAGVAILSALRPAGGDDVVLAAYYQGLTSVREHGLYADTRRYVADVLTVRERYR